jgi:hypothetical protein
MGEALNALFMLSRKLSAKADWTLRGRKGSVEAATLLGKSAASTSGGLSGYAAVATAGEEIAAVHADGRPQRDSMRIDKIDQFRI